MVPRVPQLARVAGVDVRLAPSLLLFAALMAWSLTTTFVESFGLVTALVLAGTGTVLFFASVLAHELGHALEARHRDLEVHGITLFLFGGVTEMDGHGETPRDELAVAAVGPWLSLVSAAVFGLVATFAPAALPAPVGVPVGALAGLLGWLNLALAAFNLIPGAPLDGGRVLRATIWWISGDRRRAIRVAARAGQLLGLAVAGWGIYTLSQTGANGLIGSGAFVLVGAFLFSAARTELRHTDLDPVLDGTRVSRLLDLEDRGPAAPDTATATVDADARVRAIVDVFVAGHERVTVTRDDVAVATVTEAELARALHTAGESQRGRRRPEAQRRGRVRR